MAHNVPRRWDLERVERFVGRLKPSLFRTLPAAANSVALEMLSIPIANRASFLADHSHTSVRFDQVKTMFERGGGKPCEVGIVFGPTWSTHWFKCDLAIDSDTDSPFFLFNANGEALVYDQRGELLQGLTGPGPFQRHEMPLRNLIVKELELESNPQLKSKCECEQKAQCQCQCQSQNKTQSLVRLTLYIEVACNTLFGAGRDDIIAPPDPDKKFVLELAAVASLDRNLWRLYHDLDVLIGIARHYKSDLALYVSNTAVNACVDVSDAECVEKACCITADYFKRNHGAAADCIGRPRVFAMSNCHIDTAWLWPYAESVRKCARSWSSVLGLIDEGYDLQFALPQAQQLAWVKEQYPSLFDRLRKSPRVHVVGGSWVENDTNIPNSESLIRQFVLGQAFFLEHFGRRCTEYWLPDCFGYCAQLPQILRGVGCKTFITQKLSWNMYNKFPYHFFNWQGLDGSSVLTHFPPTDTYCSALSVEELKRHEDHFAAGAGDFSSPYAGVAVDSLAAPASLLLYGVGDGGGGPTREHQERLTRLRDVHGLPRIDVGTLEDVLAHNHQPDGIGVPLPDLPTWCGELYLEMHRGCATSQAKTKLGNRECEALLHQCEMWCTAAHCLCSSDSADPYSYPYAQLREMWEKVLLCQFHDVLPGSSIEQVYIDSLELYDSVRETGKQILEDCTRRLALHVRGANGLGLGLGSVPSVVVFNALSWPRSEVVGDRVLSAPACGWACHEDCVNGNRDTGSLPLCTMSVRAGMHVLENQFIRVSVKEGEIVSLIHKFVKGKERECVPPGMSMNKIAIYEDRALYWDAWDLSEHHQAQPVSLPVAETSCNGQGDVPDYEALSVSIEHTLKLSDKSWIKRSISIDAVSPYVTISNTCEWREAHRVLKAEFPIKVNATEATYEIQSGHLRRPAHSNTSWQSAQFEVYAQRWADLSEHGFGVALLNDCKYGHSAYGNTLSLTLLRSPKRPDEHCDMGLHRFRFALLPHEGGPVEGGVVRAAAAFNEPLFVRNVDAGASTPAPAPAQVSMCSVPSESSVVVQSFKMAEDRTRNAVVLRLYESGGGDAECDLDVSGIEAAGLLQSVSMTNMLEDDVDGDVECAGAGACSAEVPAAYGRVALNRASDGRCFVRLRLRAWEIVTLILRSR